MGANEIGFTILSMTLSLAAVFLPVLFMGGVLGRLLNEFAVTIMSAILVSGFVSLTLTPMLCSRFITSHRNERHGRLFNSFERIQDGLANVYDRCLNVVLRHQAGNHDRFIAPAGRHCLPLHGHSERFSAERGYRAVQRHDRSGRRHFVRRDGGTSEASCRDHCSRSGSRLRDVPDRWRRAQHQSRAIERAAEAALATPAGGSGDAIAAAKTGERARNFRIHAQRSADSNRRPAKQSALPVHAAKSGYAEPVSLSAGISRQRCGRWRLWWTSAAICKSAILRSTW